MPEELDVAAEIEHSVATGDQEEMTVTRKKDGTTMQISEQHEKQLGLGAGVVYHLSHRITEPIQL